MINSEMITLHYYSLFLLGIIRKHKNVKSTRHEQLINKNNLKNSLVITKRHGYAKLTTPVCRTHFY